MIFHSSRFDIHETGRAKSVAPVFFLVLVLSFLAGIGETFGATPPGRVWKNRASVRWSAVPLRDALERFADIQSFVFFLDRRIDPSLSLEFEATNQPLDRLLESLARSFELDCFFLGDLVYMGPPESVGALPKILEDRQKQIAAMPVRQAELFRSAAFRKKQTLNLPILSEPKSVLQALAGRHGLSWKNLDELPHDVWAETKLVGTAPELLTLLLIGFDRCWQTEDGRTLEIVPISESWQVVSEKREEPATTPATPRRETPKVPLAQRRFTLRVEDQQLDVLLETLSDRVGLELRKDEPSIAAKGISGNQRVSFEVKNATAAEMFRTFLRPLKLEFRIRGDTITVY